MTWFGGPIYLAALAVVVAIRLGVDWWLLHTGRIVHYRVVSHRKLRAAGHVSDRARIGGAAVTTTSEPPHPGRGPSPATPPRPGPNSGPLTVDLARDPFPVVDGSHPEEAQTAVSADSRPAFRGGLGPKQAAEGGTRRAAPSVPTSSSGLEARTVAPPTDGPGPHTPVDATTSDVGGVHRAPVGSPA